MAHKAKTTEPAGGKQGRGAYHGPKRNAKRGSARARRRADRKSLPADTLDEPFLTIGARARPGPKSQTTRSARGTPSSIMTAAEA